MDHIPTGTTQGGGFDPRQAADLLDQATRQARRQFTPLSPPLFTFRAVAVLVVFGGCWLSVRGQHPYTGHISGWAIAAAVVLVAVNIGWTAWVIGRAGTGVSGPAQRKWQAWTGIMVAAWIIGYADHRAAVPRRGQPSGLGAVPGQRAAADHRPGRRGRRGGIPVLAVGRRLPWPSP